MKKKHILTILLLMMTVTHKMASQTNVTGFDRFTVSAPDTIIQGEPFQVTYILSASTWGSGIHPRQEKGFRLTDVAYTTQRGHPYSLLYTKATYITSQTGMVELPSMIAQIHQKQVTSAPRSIYIKPHPQYGKEMSVAHDWLVKHGQDPDSISLEKGTEDEDFLIFQDKDNQCFCVVAKKDVWPLVGIPVLAYSTESSIGDDSDNQSHQLLFQPYREQIKALKSSVGKSSPIPSPLYSPKYQSVNPLLGTLAWGQRTPYNHYAPILNKKKVVVGCVPIAVAMVMYYYQWPEQGRSQVYYQPDDNIYKMDFNLCTPLWKTYQKCYQHLDTAKIGNLSNLLISLGFSLNAKFSDTNTSASCSNVKHVLCNNFRYSGRMMFYHEQLTENETVSLIYRELDEQRPCIVTNNKHAFVCDGYQGEFLHYNLGWHGFYNGYYRLKLGNYTQTNNNELILIKGVIGGIEPQQDEDLSKKVDLQKAGTLTEVLSEQEKEHITTLFISGPINSADIRLLRKMAGAIDEDFFSSWRGGALRVLNLTQAQIEDDTQPYLTQKATGTRTRITNRSYSNGTTIKKTFSFNFETMKESDWNDFKNIIGEIVDGGFYTRTDDNKYWFNYTCIKNEIGNHMFEGCTSLYEIYLPEDTKRIGNYAFMGCSSIQNIRLPENVQEIGTIPFNQCTSLESIEIPKELSLHGIIYDKCSPILNNVKRY